MNIYIDCYPCFLRQAIEASRISGVSETTQKIVLDSVIKDLLEIPNGVTPPHIGRQIHRLIKKVTGNSDPYKDIKIKQNKQVLKMKSGLEDYIEKSFDPLMTAVKLAGVGNLIDMGPQRQWNDVKSIFTDFSDDKLTQFEYMAFTEALHNAKRLLYIGDNAGEIVLDKILIQQIKAIAEIEITYAVRGKPIINDATREDAAYTGIDDVVTVIDTGDDFPGVNQSTSSEEFLQCFSAADVILAKGQGNYESLSDEQKNIFFLLKAKCPVIAHHIGCSLGELVFIKQSQL